MITPKQLEVLEAIEEYTQEQGSDPPAARIAEMLGITHSAVYTRLAALRRKGHVINLGANGALSYWALRGPSEKGEATWMTYAEAAEHLRLNVGYVRNLVNAGQVPVYGSRGRRRFVLPFVAPGGADVGERRLQLELRQRRQAKLLGQLCAAFAPERLLAPAGQGEEHWMRVAQRW